MTETAAAPGGPSGSGAAPPARRNPLVTHPMTSLLIGLLLAASIVGTLVVPIYASITPRVGDFPFFYFYLLAYMPVAAVALWLVTVLQRRLPK